MDGGGAIFVRGGRFRAVNTGFYGNRCASTGPDIGGASLQVFSQYNGLPVYLVNDTFGGSGARRNECSNGGAISSIGVSWTILNSLFTGNHAIGSGANPAASGTPGGGNGGAIYNDGNEMTLHVEGTRIDGNTSNHEGGSGIFFVSNDRTRLRRDRRLAAAAQHGRRLQDLPRDLLPGRHDHVHRTRRSSSAAGHSRPSRFPEYAATKAMATRPASPADSSVAHADLVRTPTHAINASPTTASPTQNGP